tara:strand:- start:682 stop:1854 length:1173 start_codon:yes stop_codon:yes gene_type:complete
MHSFPKRNAFVFDIVDAAKNVQNHYTVIGEDPGYGGHFEKEFCNKFTDFMGGGMCDAVSSGTTALYVAIRALHLPPQSTVLVSAVTDPGTINAIILNDLVPQLVDSEEHSYNVSVKNILDGMKSKPSGVVIVHASGLPVDMVPIMKRARDQGIKVVEDCSQAHGAVIGSSNVGTFGDISAFSMMNRKNIAVNGTAGMVYSRNEELFKQALAIADRGKPVWLKEYPDNDPRGNLFPSLNFNLDEISCSLGITAMTKIDEVIRKRRIVAGEIQDAINSKSKYFYVNYPADKASPFVIPVYIKKEVRNEIDVSKYAENLRRLGVPLNPHYRYLVSSWPYVSSFLSKNSRSENAALTINESFVLYLNENYKAADIDFIIEKMVELERSIERFHK